jgi:hypothetical protein
MTQIATFAIGVPPHPSGQPAQRHPIQDMIQGVYGD